MHVGAIGRITKIVLVTGAIVGCQSTMYRALESVGIEKRDILVDRVSDARDAQTAAKEQFSSALDQFRSVVQVDGGDLERAYDRLDAEYSRCERDAQDVRDRIDSVEGVGDDLFEEWQDELDQYSDANLRRDSERLLRQTKQRYTALLASMRRAERSMGPVLALFRDQVLVLKHNLNAQAIGSLRNELDSIERRTSMLIGEMERSIAEANEFIGAIR